MNLELDLIINPLETDVLVTIAIQPLAHDPSFTISIEKNFFNIRIRKIRISPFLITANYSAMQL